LLLLVVRVRVWLGLPPLAWLVVRVRVSRLLSLRVGLLLLPLLVRGSGQSVLLPLFLAVRSLERSLACRRRRSSHRRWCGYTRVGYAPSAAVLPAGPQQRRLLLSLRPVRVRAGRGLPRLALLLVQVQVSPPLLSLRVALLLLPLLVRGSGESVLLPLFLAARSPAPSLACRRRRSSCRRWCRYTPARYTPSEGLPSGPQQGLLLPLSLLAHARVWPVLPLAPVVRNQLRSLERRRCRSSRRGCCRYSRAACRPSSEGLPWGQGGRAGGVTPRQAR